MTLDLSNNILGNGGCHVLESCIHGVRCVSTLDISDNGIDVEMAGVLLSISRNKSMKKLILNKNFQNMKSKHAATVIDAFVHLLQVSSFVWQQSHEVIKHLYRCVCSRKRIASWRDCAWWIAS